MFQDPAKIDYIKEKLLLTWSPEQIANTPCELKMPSTRTIYRWIYERYVDVNLKVLRRKGKSRGKRHGFLLEGYYVDLSATASARTASRTSAAAAAKQGNGNRQNAAAVAYDAFYQSRTAAVAATKENED